MIDFIAGIIFSIIVLALSYIMSGHNKHNSHITKEPRACMNCGRSSRYWKEFPDCEGGVK